MGGIYEVRHCDALWWNDIHTKFNVDWFRHSSNIKVKTATICESAVLVLLTGGIYEVRR
jgi:hypothetical protein